MKNNSRHLVQVFAAATAVMLLASGCSSDDQPADHTSSSSISATGSTTQTPAVDSTEPTSSSVAEKADEAKPSEEKLVSPQGVPYVTEMPDQPGEAIYAPHGFDDEGFPVIDKDAPIEEKCAVLKSQPCNAEDIEGLKHMCERSADYCEELFNRQ